VPFFRKTKGDDQQCKQTEYAMKCGYHGFIPPMGFGPKTPGLSSGPSRELDFAGINFYSIHKNRRKSHTISKASVVSGEIIVSKMTTPVPKIWIGFDGKASADEKAQHTGEGASILNRQITPPSDVRRIFEMGLKHSRFKNGFTFIVTYYSLP
jgi:hypothetical protein